MSRPRVAALVLAVSICSQQSVGITTLRPVDKVPVDVVYTWMPQPSKAEFRTILRDCPDLHEGWSRVRDLDQLRFSLRLLDQNIPWVRQVFLITDGSAPSWLNTSKVKVIDQYDLIPQNRKHIVSPIHNSQQVETYMHRIPGLAEHFIYFNDDMFVGRPLAREFFFKDGKPVLYKAAGDKIYQDPYWRHRPEPGTMMGRHTAYPLTIHMIKKMQAMYPKFFGEVSTMHCRTKEAGKGPPWLYQWFGVQSHLAVLRSSNAKFAFLKGDAEASGESLEWYSKQLSDPPHLGCINDNFDTEDEAKFDWQVKQLSRFMDDFSGGKPSKFEKEVQVMYATTHNTAQQVFSDRAQAKLERFRKVRAWLEEFRSDSPQ